MVVVIDSDRDRPGKVLNATKRRILAEWKDQPGFVWVTRGREIENYVPNGAFWDALNPTASGKKHRQPKSPYDKCIPVTARGRAVAEMMKVSHWLVENGRLTLEPLDLAKNIKHLAEFIRKSNQSSG
jgi:hypothetical protein